jgi:hypothetical protein
MNDSQNTISEFIAESNSDAFLYSTAIADSFTDRFIELVTAKKNRRSIASLFITTYGGDPDAAYRMARCLRKNYERVRILIPGMCKSAGTLVALAGHELCFSCYGEIGPLDTQINKPDELLSRHSGLDILQSMDSITRSTFDCFETHMLHIIRASSGAISTKVAADIAIQLTTGMIAPITAQVDPVRLGSAQRAIDIARAYGKRLSAMSNNLKPNALDQLIDSYPAHGFVIDYDEAKELFNRVDEFKVSENNLYRLFAPVMRAPHQDGIVLDIADLVPIEEESTDEKVNNESSPPKSTSVPNQEPTAKRAAPRPIRSPAGDLARAVTSGERGIPARGS